jgi:asparagine synthase (glutamine-hydrolysing)
MPGIVGIISHRSPEECDNLVMSMARCMQHERFHTLGTYSIPEMGIYAGWVAHENSFAAGQTFFNEQRDTALILSGECFVDPEIPMGLKQKGHRLQQNRGDWLVHFYEEEGDQFFGELNGLFSGLLIDTRERKACLFNDRYGMERIYWHETKDAFYFASEAKALLRALPELRVFDEEGVAQFLAFGCTLGERTLFRNIQVLPGGAVWSFQGGNCHKQKYFSAEIWQSQPTLSAESFETSFQETFTRILPRYFESESKIGISLTAGLDSRMIMACRPETAEKPVCYTFSSQNQDTLDARLAARVAGACGLEHQVLRIGQDFFSDFASHADRTVYFTDGCLGILGAHEIYMNEQARQLAPVRLTGNYGSEVLRGASTFKPLNLSHHLMNPDFGLSVRFSAQELSRGNEHPVTFAAFREIPQKRFGVLAAGRSQSIFRTPYFDNQIVALAFQAPQSLLSSPLSALRLVKDNNPVLAQIPTDMGLLAKNQTLTAHFKSLFCKAAFKLDYVYNEGLPHSLARLDPLLRLLNSGIGILGLHKYLHYRSWFQRELAVYVNEILTDARTHRNRFWNSDLLEGMARDHRLGRKNYVHEINAVITLGAVERLLFRDLPRGLTGTSPIFAIQSCSTKKDQRADVVRPIPSVSRLV